MTSTPLSRRLTTLDSTFLYFEKPEQPMHIGGCMVYEGRLTRDELEQMLLARLHRLPRYRQTVVFPPFALAHPTWEDDPHFDIGNHVEEATLPPPADDRVLAEVGGRVYGGMLDRRHPLWKLILLHGHRDGNTVVIWKIHHAMVDGVSGVDLTMVLHDVTADAPPPAPPALPWRPGPLPDPLRLLEDAVRDRLTEAAQALTEAGFRLLKPAEMSDRARQLTGAVSTALPSLLEPAPRTPFNAPLSAERSFAWQALPFADIRAIRSALGGTVNDLVLTILGGALGKYLRADGHRTEGVVLRAMCPVSMRREDEHGALGNLVSVMIAPLFVGIADPVERLASSREAMERLKKENQADGLYSLQQLLNGIPAAWQAFAGQLTVPQTLFNTVSTNVPGPQIPLYLGGRRLLNWIPLGICATNVGLFVGILSYDGKLTFGLTMDAKLMSNGWRLADCLRESFEELRAAAERA
ncbi:MAG TPA: wax ester/triacylglycerol synthase family O-acyltransferase [Methylomirabilota bacterium]|jgi:WS/DGAT/MGAT family acyltransferase|nr:wax ester/triacylglycerol synthase family O-acyltransferase [Methylomirabilota bacterium]